MPWKMIRRNKAPTKAACFGWIATKSEVFPYVIDAISVTKNKKQLSTCSYIAEFQNIVGRFSLTSWAYIW